MDSQDQSGRVRKIPLSPGFDHRTVQPAPSRYTDLSTPPTSKSKAERSFWYQRSQQISWISSANIVIGYRLEELQFLVGVQNTRVSRTPRAEGLRCRLRLPIKTFTKRFLNGQT